MARWWFWMGTAARVALPLALAVLIRHFALPPAVWISPEQEEFAAWAEGDILLTHRRPSTLTAWRIGAGEVVWRTHRYNSSGERPVVTEGRRVAWRDLQDMAHHSLADCDFDQTLLRIAPNLTFGPDLHLSPTGNMLLAPTGPGAWRLVDLREDGGMRPWELGDGEFPIVPQPFSPDGRWLATFRWVEGDPAGATLWIWDTASLTRKPPIRGLPASRGSMAWLADDGGLIVDEQPCPHSYTQYLNDVCWSKEYVDRHRTRARRMSEARLEWRPQLLVRWHSGEIVLAAIGPPNANATEELARRFGRQVSSDKRAPAVASTVPSPELTAVQVSGDGRWLLESANNTKVVALKSHATIGKSIGLLNTEFLGTDLLAGFEERDDGSRKPTNWWRLAIEHHGGPLIQCLPSFSGGGGRWVAYRQDGADWRRWADARFSSRGRPEGWGMADLHPSADGRRIATTVAGENATTRVAVYAAPYRLAWWWCLLAASPLAVLLEVVAWRIRRRAARSKRPKHPEPQYVGAVAKGMA